MDGTGDAESEVETGLKDEDTDTGSDSGEDEESEGVAEGGDVDDESPTSDDGESDGEADGQDADTTQDSGSTAGTDGESGESEEEADADTDGDAEASAGGGFGAGDDIPEVDLPDGIMPMDIDNSGRDKIDWDKTPYVSSGRYADRYPQGLRKGRAESITRISNQSTVTKQIRRHLKIMSKDSHVYGLRRGRLHGKNVHRIYTGTDNPRIFKQKVNHQLKTDTAVQIMMDCSGSMGFDQYNLAAACIVAMAITLQDLRIPFEILGYTDNGTIITYIFKEFGENITREKLVERFSATNIGQHCNADGESVLIGATRLMARKEHYKVQFVLSDGLPAAYGTGDDNWYLKQVCELIEESSPIELIGIGIETDSPRHFYKKNAVVMDINQLDAVLLGVLKDKLL
jgi:cobalamin biosynthesis protein CobT